MKRFMLGMCLGFGTMLATAVAQGKRPLSPQDILMREKLSDVQISPDGKQVAYALIPAAIRAPNIGTMLYSDNQHINGKIFLFDLEHADRPEPLPDQNGQTGYWPGKFSADGTKLIVYSVAQGVAKIGAYDLKTQKATWFDLAPNLLWRKEQALWTSNHELVFAALPEGQQPVLATKLDIIRKYNALWEKSLNGQESSATVLYSGPNSIEQHPTDSADPAGWLLLADAATGKTSRLGAGLFTSLRLSPDRRSIAALRQGARETSGSTTDWQEPTVQHLAVYNLQTHHEIIPCPACDVFITNIEWSPDSRRLLFISRADATSGTEEQSLLHQYDFQTSSLKNIFDSRLRLSSQCSLGAIAIPVGSGSSVAVLARPLGEKDQRRFSFRFGECQGQFDWYVLTAGRSPRKLTGSFNYLSRPLIGLTTDSLFVLADRGVWKVGLNGQRRRLALFQSDVSPWWSGFVSGYDAFPTYRYPSAARALLEDDTHLAVVSLRNGHVRFLKKIDSADLLAVADSATSGLFLHLNPLGETQLLAAGQTMAPRRLVTINSHLHDVANLEQVDLEYEFEGHKLSSCALLPPDRRTGKRSPLIVYIYPYAQQGICDREDEDMQLLAAHGFMVLYAANPEALIRTTEKPTGKMTPVVLAAVDRAIEAGYADPDRLGIYGFSQGNHSALQIISETNRFKAAIAGNGISDLLSHYGTAPISARLNPDTSVLNNVMRYEETGPNTMGGPPWKMAERYIENSPVFHADRIQTPLLILHSDFDVFPLGQSEEIFNALYRQGKEAVYVTYWGEGHGNRSPANMLDGWQRMFRWYDEHLVAPDHANAVSQRSPNS